MKGRRKIKGDVKYIRYFRNIELSIRKNVYFSVNEGNGDDNGN